MRLGWLQLALPCVTGGRGRNDLKACMGVRGLHVAQLTAPCVAVVAAMHLALPVPMIDMTRIKNELIIYLLLPSSEVNLYVYYDVLSMQSIITVPHGPWTTGKRNSLFVGRLGENN